MGGRKWLWRLRRNPLRRGCDVAEGWAAVAAAALIAVGAPLAGTVTASEVADSVRAGEEGRRPVPAVVLRDVARPIVNPYTGMASSRVQAPVRYTAPDGSARSGRAAVESGSRAGQRTKVWLDRDGEITSPPPSIAEAIVLGTLAASGVCVLLLGGRRLVRVSLDRRRYAAWERQWAEVGPRWAKRPR